MRKISILISVGTVVLAVGLLPTTAKSLLRRQCMVCEDSVAFCWSLTEHTFPGTPAPGSQGYEGYHSNTVCGSCNSAHVWCPLGALQDVREGLAGRTRLPTVIRKYPEAIDYDGGTGRLRVRDCSGEGTILLTEAEVGVVNADLELTPTQ